MAIASLCVHHRPYWASRPACACASRSNAPRTSLNHIQKGTPLCLAFLPGVLEDPENGLLGPLRALLAQLQCELKQLQSQIDEADALIAKATGEHETCRRLMAIPGAGPADQNESRDRLNAVMLTKVTRGKRSRVNYSGRTKRNRQNKHNLVDMRFEAALASPC